MDGFTKSGEHTVTLVRNEPAIGDATDPILFLPVTAISNGSSSATTCWW
jgi:hypothetical protein